MELWIRSQDGHKILKVNEIYVCKHDNNHVYGNTSNAVGIELGNYATKQRALAKRDKEIERLNNIILELSKKNRNLLEDNMRLRKELNLHSGKLYISDIEVKNIF